MGEFPTVLMDAFMGWVDQAIEDAGFGPHRCMYLEPDGSLAAAVLALSLQSALAFFWDRIVTGSCTAIIMGVDRFARPGQGNEFKDLITVFQWHQQPGDLEPQTVRCGVVDYKIRPKIIRPINYRNVYWNEVMCQELALSRPAELGPPSPDYSMN